MNRLLGVLMALACLFGLAGCEQELYTGLSEVEVNEMVAALSSAGISGQKLVQDGQGQEGRTWTLTVDQADMGPSLAVLRAQGLPRPRLASLGQVFQKQGLVATPAEERVRYIYGVSQELSRTLLDVDGVMLAHVHVVIPENDPLADKAKPASAAVYIRYRPGVNLTAMAPMVKDLVAHSIEGLSYDNVSLFLQGAQPVPVDVRKGAALLGTFSTRNPLVWLLGLLIVAALVVTGLVAWRRGVFDNLAGRGPERAS
ncbi:EscJ/YscJ/HrcJ family type III secretion inner membrane ring protein [Ralstonia pickettii]|uniref:Lipoprotein n=1 Tax=Ralstonia pickettii TaxID=329 RepID=A0A2N4TQA2_RALPI|nr:MULTISPECIES: type III secretion inner membrane ring lipoprotein SctJ [Ralstonia]PLC41885.1 EscJ/YscJ/HrcJ family type III secretion inner membrane ring protein [Ralstonia pickettii]